MQHCVLYLFKRIKAGKTTSSASETPPCLFVSENFQFPFSQYLMIYSMMQHNFGQYLSAFLMSHKVFFCLFVCLNKSKWACQGMCEWHLPEEEL